MGKQKYQKQIEALFNKSPIVSYSSIERIIRQKKNTNYTKQLVRNLILKDKIRKLSKGVYTSRNTPQLAVLSFKPSYLGLQDALSFHNLWEQETIPVIITSRKIRSGIRSIMGSNILIRKIDPKLLFGFDYLSDGEIYLPYSDIEKTLIDMVYFKEKLSEEAQNNIIRTINKKKLESYLKHYPKRTQEQVRKIIRNMASPIHQPLSHNRNLFK